jgi:hypothetical protein
MVRRLFLSTQLCLCLHAGFWLDLSTLLCRMHHVSFFLPPFARRPGGNTGTPVVVSPLRLFPLHPLCMIFNEMYDLHESMAVSDCMGEMLLVFPICVIRNDGFVVNYLQLSLLT